MSFWRGFSLLMRRVFIGALFLLIIDWDFSDRTGGLVDEICTFEAFWAVIGWAGGVGELEAVGAVVHADVEDEGLVGVAEGGEVACCRGRAAETQTAGVVVSGCEEVR